MPGEPQSSSNPETVPHRPFRRAVLRGLAILMPPLLTIVLFIWAWSIIERYALVPVEQISRWTYREATRHVIKDIPFASPETDPHVSRDDSGEIVSFNFRNRVYTKSGNGRWVGKFTDDYVRDNKLPRWKVLAAFLPGFVLVLYFLGKFVAAGIGRMLVNSLERLIHRLPLVSNVYASVKQVTDFVFSEREIEFNRVVAVEYPRKGLWSVGFVTGASMLDIRASANEAVLSVFIPTSPMPMTGFTITVAKSDAIDLNMTVDQAIQFVVSCGVVVPPQQQIPRDDSALKIAMAVAQHAGNNGENGRSAESQPKDTIDSSE